MDNETVWKIIHSHFEENPHSLVSHHLDSFDDFFKTGIFTIFKEKNPMQFQTKKDDNGNYKYQCNLYFGGKDGTKLYFGKPAIHDDGKTHYMFPNEARLRNMTYSMTIHYDIDIEFIYLLEHGETPKNVSDDMISEMVDLEQIEVENGELSDGENPIEDEFFSKRVEHVDGGSDTVSPDEAATSLYSQYAGAKKAAAEKRGIKGAKYTTGVAAMIREAMEKSVVAPNHQVYRTSIRNVFLGRFPIMVQSSFCILNGLSREMRYSMGECKNDLGGYFIIDGKERTVIMQEKFGDNMMYIRKGSPDDKFTYTAELKSVSENPSKPVRTLAVRLIAPTTELQHGNIVVNIPNVRAPVPLFIVFRALGITSDREIIDYCLLDREKFGFLEDLFAPCVYDAGQVMTQQAALHYISQLTKYHTVKYAMVIINDYLLPHVGESNYIEKAYHLGNIVFRLLCVSNGLEAPTDRDNYKFKRVEVVGSLLFDLFKEYYTIQMKHIHLEYERALYMNKDMYEENLHKLIFDKQVDAFATRIVEDGFRKAFKGNWGAAEHTKRIGIVQVLDRLSYNSALSHLRKTNLPLDSSVKLVGPRVLHSSHWGYIDPIDTPDGGNIGLHKTLAIFTCVSRGVSREPMIEWMRENIEMRKLDDLTPLIVSTMTKVMINGYWAGVVSDPIGAIRKIRLYRRNALLPVHTSATFHIKHKTIYVYTDAGRVYRPIFYKDVETEKFSYELMANELKTGDFTWTDLIAGFNRRRSEIDFKPSYPVMYTLSQLYTDVPRGERNPAKVDTFLKRKSVLEYVDPSETDDLLIAMSPEDLVDNPQAKYTHMELHPSTIFGVMCNHIIFPENNPPTRNSFSCGQSKQAVSLYHSNYQVRIDKMGVVLNSGQVPLVKSRYLEYINHEEQPYGVNTMVAIMCYTGYNVEDAVLINEGALHRGLFRTTYYTGYEAHEETSKHSHVTSDIHFTNIEQTPNVRGLMPGYDYSHLDDNGLIREGTPVDDRTVLVGMVSTSSDTPDVARDVSKKPKKGQLGIVDKSFITEGEQGERIAKVRVREERQPTFGDKMASRAGQKGTVGLVVPEKDMPFTKDGIRPDIIINPHALPTRMTIGQLVECITGKACAMYGGFGDCTAFNNRGSKIGVFGEMLVKQGFHSSGNEIMYNGMTGEQIEMEIFMGPTYYMRLKHMVKDKINYRATGPRTAMTRQPVAGRANDGGLRIGEMERDVLVSHGMNNFLRESMLVRGDRTYMAVCNNTGLPGVYNPSKNQFLSPAADGPLKYETSVNGQDMSVETISRYGRSFSVVEVPYAFKLMLQELQAANIHPRIITEDNVKQIENLICSDNYKRLLNEKKSVDLEEIQSRNLTQINYVKDRMNRIDKDTTNTHKLMRTGDIPKLKKIDVSSSSVEKSAMQLPSSDQISSSGQIPSSNEIQLNTQYIEPNLTQQQQQPNPNTESETNLSAFSAEIPQKDVEQHEEKAEIFKKGGGIGNKVLYRGSGKMGLSPSDLWTIRRIGDGYITIEMDEPDKPLNMHDRIQVVAPNELYLPSDDFYNKMSMMQDIHRKPDSAFMSAIYQTPTQPAASGITFSPNIRIVNGPDHSTNTGLSTEPSANMPTSHVGISPDKNNMNVDTTNIPTTIPTVGVSGIPRDVVSRDRETEDNKPVDFSNIVIRKMP